jgi:hypothetical protein
MKENIAEPEAQEKRRAREGESENKSERENFFVLILFHCLTTHLATRL